MSADSVEAVCLDPAASCTVSESISNDATPTCIIEVLPSEIRHHLLSRLPLPELKALTLASPVYYQQYTYSRQFLLRESLKSTLGGTIVDAYAVYQTRDPVPAQQSTPVTDIQALAKSYQANTKQRWLPQIDDLNNEEIRDMAKYYLQFVQPVVEHAGSWLLGNFSRKGAEQKRLNNLADHLLDLTRSEASRLTRAAYRLQLFHQLRQFIRNAPVPTNESDKVVLFDVHEQWEHEETFCFYEFVKNLLILCGRQSNPRVAFPWGVGLPLDANFPWGSLEYWATTPGQHPGSHEMEQVVQERTGLEMVQALLPPREKWDHEKLVLRRWPSYPNQRALPFCGDGKSDAPPFAWTELWNEAYAYVYILCLVAYPRRWGCIFWDKKRFHEPNLIKTKKKSANKRAIAFMKEQKADFGKWTPDCSR
ncbi:hypothetical protein F5Y16DRAFT_423109 [Xylariaceae sp. FL0255]|nr:hypothetical protein F5Y16DRAFT_423109 [Xylariaceae sp. FL0255]